MNCCCGTVKEQTSQEASVSLEIEKWIRGFVSVGDKKIPLVKTELAFQDRLGAFKVRWGWERMDYQVTPGLYGIGNPKPESPVLVTANYKLTFDSLRRHLGGLDAWILVLDTKGVNVWCAAGKGTFGTEELVKRIASTGLAEVVAHRKLILPQLGAVGVAAHKVKEETGFTVQYGPVFARDLPAYLAAGCLKTPAMRRVRFDFFDRLVLVPIELVGAKLLYPILAVAGFSIDLLINRRPTFASLYYFGALVGAVFAGAVLTPLLLPYIRLRAFALKGLVAGLLWCAAYLPFLPGPNLLLWGFGIIITTISSFLAMNFTGASTYTSQSGATLEVKLGLPVQGAALVVGIALVVAAGILGK